MEEPVVSIIQIPFDLGDPPKVTRAVQDIVDDAQIYAIEIVRKRWIDEHLDDPNNWPSIAHALQAWFDEVHATMRVLLHLT